MRKLDSKIIVAFIFVVAFGLYFFFRSSVPSTTDSEAKPILTYGTKEEENLHESEKNARAALADQTLNASSSDPTQSQDSRVRIQTWLGEEAKNLNQPHIDTRQKDLELKKIIENFSDEDKNFVLQTALDTSRAANERILAAYMIVLDQSQNSHEKLNQLAKKALPDFGPVTPHSEAEIRRGQELAVRYMAIDELAKRAATDSQALDTLKNLVNSGESAEIKGYASRVLKEIK